MPPLSRRLRLLTLLAAVGIGATGAFWWWRQRPMPVAVDMLLVGSAAWDPTSLNTATLFLEERPGSRIRLVTLYNRTEPAHSPASIAALKRQGVRFFLSTHPSSHLLASLAEFSRGDALAINTAAASSALSGRDDYLLRVVPDVRQEQRAIAAAVHELANRDPAPRQRRRLLVLQDTANPSYTTTALAVFRTELERLGGWQLEVRPLRVSAFDPQRDRQLLQGDHDALYVLAGLFQVSIGHVSQLFHQLHPDAPILLTPWARSPEVIATIGPARANTLLTSPFAARRHDPALNRYLERFQQRFGYSPGALAISTRQGIELLDQALAAGAQTPSDVKRFLLSKPEHRSSLGPVRLNADGDHAGHFSVFPAAADLGR